MTRIYWSVGIAIPGTAVYMREEFDQEHKARAMYDIFKNTKGARVTFFRVEEEVKREPLHSGV
jgi:hypothetical protein